MARATPISRLQIGNILEEASLQHSRLKFHVSHRERRAITRRIHLRLETRIRCNVSTRWDEVGERRKRKEASRRLPSSVTSSTKPSGSLKFGSSSSFIGSSLLLAVSSFCAVFSACVFFAILGTSGHIPSLTRVHAAPQRELKWQLD